MEGILGTKVGMTAIFDDTGAMLPVTVISTGGNIVAGKRTEQKDGYTALIIGFGEKRAKNSTKPEIGFFEKQGLMIERDDRKFVKRHLKEFRLSADALEKYEVGAELTAASLFKAGERCDVTGTSKGRGFAGVMKRHNFHGAKATHGVHEYFRHGGSIGTCTTPGRVFKNKQMPGHYGATRCTIQSLRVVEVMDAEHLVLVRGSVPGPNGGLVMIRKAAKKSF